MSVLDSLKTKAGPLPVWAWAAIPAGAYVAYSYYKAASGGNTDAPTDDFMSPVGDDFDTGFPSIPPPDEPPTSDRPLPEPDPYTNADWERDAVSWAIGQGLNPLAAITGVRAYLYGRPSSVNREQMNILRQIIVAKGSAPDGGNIPPLSEVSHEPPDKNTAIPAPPGGVGLRKIQGKLQATWNASRTANVRYEVEHKRDKGPWVLLRSTDNNHAEFEAREGAHTVRVRARNKHGYSAYAQSNTLVIARDTQPPKRKANA